MSAGEFVDGVLGRFLVHVVLVLGLAAITGFAIDPQNHESFPIAGAGILMPGVGWALGVAYGRREVYRTIGRTDEHP